jgi:hypothetical protein
MKDASETFARMRATLKPRGGGSLVNLSLSARTSASYYEPDIIARAITSAENRVSDQMMANAGLAEPLNDLERFGLIALMRAADIEYTAAAPALETGCAPHMTRSHQPTGEALMSSLYPEDNHPIWKIGDPVTHKGLCGIIQEVWKDDERDVFLSFSAPGHDTEEVIPENQCTPGGTPEVFPPTLTENAVDTRAYEIGYHATAVGQIPAGWFAIYTPDDQYVIWGGATQQKVMMLSIGHRMGISYLGSKF